MTTLDDDAVLVLSDRVVAASGDVGEVMNASLQLPISVNDEGWQVLALFRAASTVRDAAEAAGVDDDERPLFREILGRFVAAGLLVAPDEEEHLWREGYELWRRRRPPLTPPAVGMFGAHTTPGDADLRFVGVPFDRAASRSGAARAPSSLRATATMLPLHVDPATGRCRGLRDMADGALLLAGATLRDHGDVAFEAWRGFEDSYGRIAAAARSAFAAGGVPVFLGGDHSITEPIVRAWEGAPLFVVHFDAHTDLYPLFETVAHDHGNVMERLRRLDRVEGILQIGLRDVMPPWWKTPPGVTQLGAHRLRAMSAAEVVAAIPEGARCYVTVDIDVLDASEAPATGAPVPGGLRLLELEALVEAVALARDVVGVDLVEVAPELAPGRVTEMAALRILLRLLNAVHRRASGR
jgi:agmatinase